MLSNIHLSLSHYVIQHTLVIQSLCYPIYTCHFSYYVIQHTLVTSVTMLLLILMVTWRRLRRSTERGHDLQTCIIFTLLWLIVLLLRNLLGVVGADAVLDDLENTLLDDQFGLSYAFLVDREGRAIIHPRLEPSTEVSSPSGFEVVEWKPALFNYNQDSHCFGTQAILIQMVPRCLSVCLDTWFVECRFLSVLSMDCLLSLMKLFYLWFQPGIHSNCTLLLALLCTLHSSSLILYIHTFGNLRKTAPASLLNLAQLSSL